MTAAYYVYIIECANHALYTGMTNDLARRFKQHQTGRGARYTAANPAVKLLYSKKCGSRSLALKREAAIKKMTRANKLVLITERGGDKCLTRSSKKGKVRSRGRSSTKRPGS
ncbi:MAG: GIY-YIG nuclease family protein [Candidatus Margulisiibacteriota bacterium]